MTESSLRVNDISRAITITSYLLFSHTAHSMQGCFAVAKKREKMTAVTSSREIVRRVGHWEHNDEEEVVLHRAIATNRFEIDTIYSHLTISPSLRSFIVQFLFRRLSCMFMLFQAQRALARHTRELWTSFLSLLYNCFPNTWRLTLTLAHLSSGSTIVVVVVWMCGGGQAGSIDKTKIKTEKQIILIH